MLAVFQLSNPIFTQISAKYKILVYSIFVCSDLIFQVEAGNVEAGNVETGHGKLSGLGWEPQVGVF
ncbi:MAG: hypothetical protein ACI9RO_000123 [Alteromonas macleodii]